jgi:hypothetical protein
VHIFECHRSQINLLFETLALFNNISFSLKKIGKYLEGNSHDLFEGIIPAFAQSVKENLGNLCHFNQ